MSPALFILLDIAPGGVAAMVALGLLPCILIGAVVIAAAAVLLRALKQRRNADPERSEESAPDEDRRDP